MIFSPEEAEQAALFQWARSVESRRPELKWLIHVPNGGKRDARTGAKLKSMGARAGVADCVLPVPRCGYHGFWFEMKAGKNKLTPSQQEFLNFVEEQGHYVGVFWNWEDAKRAIENYLDGKIGVEVAK